MELEQRLEDSLAIYNCQACQHKAHKPVLTTCGHLFCWKCYFLELSKRRSCLICSHPTSETEVYPIFIEQESSDIDDSSIPERPLPVNKPKVPNADIIMPRSNHIKDNLRMGRMLAGNVLLAPLAITAYSSTEDPEEGDLEKPVSTRLKYFFLVVAVMLIVLLATYLFS